MAAKLLACFLLVFAIGVRPSQGQTTATWIGPHQGDWTNPGNWDIGVVPNNDTNETFNVIVDLETGSPYSMGGGWNITVDNLTLDSADATYRPDFNHRIENVLDVRQGMLDLDSLGGAPRYFNAGEIRMNGNSLESGNSVIERALVSDFTLNGILRLAKGASVTGDVLVANGALGFYGEAGQGDSVVVSDASIRLSSGSFGRDGDDVDVTLAQGSNLRGFGALGMNGENANFLNEGIITANVAGKSLRIETGFFVTNDPSQIPADLGGFTNRGLMRATNGAVLDLFRSNSSSLHYGEFFNDVGGTILIEQDSELNLQRDWRNRGVIDVKSGGTLTIGSDFTTRDIRPVIVRRGSKVTVNGTWDNTGQSYNFGRRAAEFEFGAALIKGGAVSFLHQPLKINKGLGFQDAQVRGDIVLDQFASSASLNNSRLFGNVWLSNQSTFSTINSNLSNIGSVTLDDFWSKFDAGDDNEDIRWFEHQTITGEGQVLVSNVGQSFRNFGTIAATKGNGMLYVASAAAEGDIFLNMGTMTATNGGELYLSFNDGKFFNGNLGSIVADTDSTVTIRRFGDGVYANNGTITLNENSSLRFEGNYDTGFFEGINPHPTSKIILDGDLNLGIGEQFAPASSFTMTDSSRVFGGGLFLSQISGEVAGTFVDSYVHDDLVGRPGSNLTLSGGTSIQGKTILNGVTANAIDTSTFGGDVVLSGAAQLTTRGTTVQRFFGNLTIAGPTTVLNAEGLLGAHGKTIDLVDGGEIHNHSRNLDLAAGVTLTGTGAVRNDLTFSNSSYFRNLGTIDVQGGNRIDILQTPGFSNGSRFVNIGEILVADGGVFATEHMAHINDARVALDGGSVIINEFATFQGGEVTGTGAITADFLYFFDGTLAPGHDGIGQLDLTADVRFLGAASQGKSTNLQFDVSGTEQGAFDGFDFLNVDGNVQFNDGSNGMLVIDIAESLTLDDLIDEELSIIEITNGDLTGSFANVLSGDLLSSTDDRFQFEVHYGADSLFGADRVVLTNFGLFAGGALIVAVPEPNAALALLLMASFASTRRRRAYR